MTKSRLAEIQEGAEVYDLAIDDRVLGLVTRYLDLLYQWNQSAGLTTIPMEAAVRLHILDSWTTTLLLDEPRSLVDLGTGAGLPGFPLAFLWPECHVALVETNRRKVSFLRAVVRELELSNVQVLRRDALVGPEGPERFQVAVARAFVNPHKLPSIAARWLESNGAVLVMAGPTAELDSTVPVGFEKVAVRQLTLPNGNEERLLVQFQQKSSEA